MYIIIETHGGPVYATIATDEDGNNLLFETYEEAMQAAGDFQEPIIVEVRQ